MTLILHTRGGRPGNHRLHHDGDQPVPFVGTDPRTSVRISSPLSDPG